MDVLSQHEAFLRAIFDAPDDDTPRLVYADFLDEHGIPVRAELIRVQCELVSRGAEIPDDRKAQLKARADELFYLLLSNGTRPKPPSSPTLVPDGMRGFQSMPQIALSSDQLVDPEELRAGVIRYGPEVFGATSFVMAPGQPVGPDGVAKLFALPFTQQVREWSFGGHVEEVAAGLETEDGGTFGLIDLIEKPVITVAGVEALAGLRAARRITSLVLTHNNLDNDAARALVRSPYLANLTRLDVYDGNRFRGKTWALLVERFGEGVVG